MSRSPSEIHTTRMARWRGCRRSLRWRASAPSWPADADAAAWKAELLSAAGAQVDVFAPSPGEPMLTLAGAAPPRGAIVIHLTPPGQPPILPAPPSRSPIAPTTTRPRILPPRPRAAGVPVNVIDRPAFCDFAFGAIVNRSPLVIGISTDGAAPVFGQAIRAKIEALIPRGFSRWADAARAWRPRVQALALPFRGRRSFWEKFTARAVAAPDRRPTEADLDALLAPDGSMAMRARSFLSAPGPAIRNC